jgi:rhamnulose-1-phosphate aldolase
VNESLSKAIETWKREICPLARLLAKRGWAEGNGGNLSIRLNDSFDPRSEEVPLDFPRPELEGCSLLMTLAGSRMRDLAENPLDNLCLVRITDHGQAYAVEKKHGKVTSEFPSHLAVHAVLVKERPDHRVLLHTHPTFLIALTHIVNEDSELIDTLIRMFPEAALLLHKNLAVLDYMLPGSEELGRATADAVRGASGVIWRGHGMLAVGKGPASALDLVEVADKAARVALLLGDKRMESGLSADQLRDICQAFGGGGA